MKRVVAGVAAFGIVLAAGCSDATGPDDGLTERADHLVIDHGNGVLFFTQDVVGADAMDALFQGTVDPDANGCLRLETDGDYGVTAVWPHGYELRAVDGTLRVVDATGSAVGTIGGTFQLGGGEVPRLTEALGFTPADQELAHEACPGRFWIVAGA